MSAGDPHSGVYIEAPRDRRAIAGVSTSRTAFVGRTLRGPVDAPVRCRSYADFEASCGGLWPDSELSYAVWHFFENGGEQAVISRVAKHASAASVELPVAGGGAPLQLEAANPGRWGERLRASVSVGARGSEPERDGFRLTLEELAPTRPGPHPAILGAAILGQASLVGASLGAARSDQAVVATETYEQLVVAPDHARDVEAVLAQHSTLARVSRRSSTSPRVVTRACFAGGDDGLEGNDADYEDAISRLEQLDIINLLVIPPPRRGVDVEPRVLASAASFCKSHRAMLLVDPPRAWSSSELAAKLTGLTFLRTPNAAFYYPRVIGPDPLAHGRPRAFAPSGMIAGVIARTDARRGVWAAPAGLEARLEGALGLTVTLTELELAQLRAAGVNALGLRASDPARGLGGPVIWSARTGRGADVMASQWKQLGVRRLGLFIHESLYWGTRWAVFEPNDEHLWAQLRRSIEAFLAGLFARGALRGASPGEAFFVKCDAETTSEAEMAYGVVNVVVGFAPLKPTQFVVLHFQQLAGL